MRKFFVSASLLLCCLFSFAQSGNEVWSAFLKALETKRINAEFSYKTLLNDVPVNGTGSFAILGKTFVLKTLEAEIYGDGTSLWTVDKEAQEVVIETFETDPIAYISLATDVKTEKGKIKSFKFKSEDSSEVEVIVKSYDISESRDTKDITFDEKSLGKGYIVTDLR